MLHILALGAVFAGLLGAAPPQSGRVVLAGGCFWGMQAVFEDLRGVTSVVAGYSGGSKDTAHYDVVSDGNTGHAESVEITYDPSRITFNDLLAVYFLVAHDPTQLNRQGPDDGTQYRSEIFYTTSAQREAAQQYIAQLERARTYSAPIVTKLAPLSGFYRAEDYHQDFVAHNPYNPYVLINDKPKLAHLRERFPALVKR
ncbi:MAG TPA: peptide-methionine (S)-S-oxide reductase MsrA [Candidatus Baltobacteraceae bacterium]|nr:peptide-methionine (S)-S-oxide reductase MsrA [Candidatus Baltobacteraceae bacterium]